MKTQLEVTKADGTVEEYSHTKVIGTISNALVAAGQPDIRIAEELAEVVTYYSYRKQNPHSVTSGEIFSIIKAVLSATGYEEAAVALTEHHFERKLRRSRIEVVAVDMQELADAKLLCEPEQNCDWSRWDKGRIVEDLICRHGVSRQTARTVASMVEEKILNMGLTVVPASLIKQLVLSDTAAVLRAQCQLQTV
jgi:transcriptional regulator NrdR family protein